MPLAVPAGNARAPFDIHRTLLLPPGWKAEVWARVDEARFAVWTPERQLLVSVPGGGEIVRLEPRADPAAPPRQRVLISGLTEPQGLAFDELDGHLALYVAESGRLDRYAWDGLRRTVVVRHLPDGDGLDRLKGIAVGRDHIVYVSVGVESPGGGPRGVTFAYRPNGGGRIFARGVGNSEGLSFDPDGSLWGARNSAGDLADGLAKLTRPHRLERLLAPHSVPLGFGFLQGSALPAPWRDGAVVAVHGSRDPTSGRRPAVLWLPWSRHTLGPPRTLVGGFRQADGTSWGRPVDAVPGPDGSLYVTDDTAGAVYRLTPG